MSTLKSQLYVEESRDAVDERVPSLAAVKPLFPDDRLQQTAALLIRELHDGVLQSLTAAVLQLEATAGLLEADAHSAHARLRDIQSMIRQQQHELRSWAERLETAAQPVAPNNGPKPILRRRG